MKMNKIIKKAIDQTETEMFEIRNQIFDLEDCIREERKDKETGNLLSRKMIAEEMREIIEKMNNTIDWVNGIQELYKDEK